MAHNQNNPNYWKYGTIALFFIILITFAGFILQNNTKSRPDPSLFITKESFNKVMWDCWESKDKQCAFRPFQNKVEKYCLDNKLSVDECDQIKLDVSRKQLVYLQEFSKEFKQDLEEMKQGLEEFKRKSGIKTYE